MRDISYGTTKGEGSKKTFLTINGRAVCLSKSRHECHKAEYKDEYFSECIIKQPVRCTQGHLLDLNHSTFWKRKYAVCPAGDHPLGPLEVDRQLENNIALYRQARKEDQRSTTTIVDQLNKLRVEAQLQQQMIEVQQRSIAKLSTEPVDPILTIQEMIAIVGKAVCITIGKTADKKTAATLAKKIPIVCLPIGLIFGIYRLLKGETKRGIGEIAAGVAACVPGYGTAISIAIDALLFGADVYMETVPGPSEEATLHLNLKDDMNLTRAYSILGIDLKQTPNPSQAQVAKAYRDRAEQLHPDVLSSRLDESETNLIATVLPLLTRAKEVVYKENKWSVDT